MMDHFGCPANVWFLCMVYVCFILDHSIESNISDGTMTPLMMSCFKMSDIGVLLVFTFWKPVYVCLDDKQQSFPGNLKEVYCHFVGISEHI